ncbi:MAG: hypothetical protein ACQCN6_03930 [Candidatus Bathyarchaeia archaeon]
MKHDLSWYYLTDLVPLGFWQRLVLRVSGSVFVGYRKFEGHRGVVPVYVVRCKRHGVYVDTPHGHVGYFVCSGCLAESAAKAKEALV